MQIAICGLQGEGKSYTAVQMLVGFLKAGRIIVTNLPVIKWTLYRDFPNADIRIIHWETLDFGSADDHANIVRGAVYIIDECHKRKGWESGTRVTDILKADLFFLREHRHFSVDVDGVKVSPDVILLTQNLKNLASAIRSTTKKTIICKKHTDIGSDKTFSRFYGNGAVEGFTVPKSMLARTDRVVKYDKKVYQYYQTHTHSTGSADSIIAESRGFFSTSIFKQPLFLLVAISSILLLISGTSGFIGDDGSVSVMPSSIVKDAKVKEKATSSVSTPISAPSKAIEPTKAVSPINNAPVVSKNTSASLSSVWRLIGRVNMPKSNSKQFHSGHFFLAKSNNGSLAYIPYDSCQIEPFIDCLMANERVTFFSGSGGGVMVSNSVSAVVASPSSFNPLK